MAAFTAHRTTDPQVPADPRQTLRTRYADLGWLARRALERCPSPPDLYYDQVVQIHLADWFRGHVVLVGDACQAVSLLAGQGASLAMAGARVLAEELTHDTGIPAALRRYQERMLPVVLGSQAAGRRTAAWFVPATRSRLLTRRAALHAMHLPGIGSVLVSRLVGTVGRLP